MHSGGVYSDVMAGRPPLRIGQHGNINRQQIEPGLWEARCRHRDADGVTRKIRRRSPAGSVDKWGKLAEDELVAALTDRRPPSDVLGNLSTDTAVMSLVDKHVERLAEDGRADATVDTYTFAADKLRRFLSGVRVGEASTARLDAALRSMRTAHGTTMAKQAKTILRGGMQLAVMAAVVPANPVRDVQSLSAKAAPKGAKGLTADELADLLIKLRHSQYCQTLDLVDPITLFIATGLRRSELLALRWVDFDEKAGTVTVAGKVVRAKGKGLSRKDTAKSAAGLRTVPLPPFAVDMLKDRLDREYYGEQEMIFPSTAGTWRDGNNMAKQWRKVRDDLNVPDVSSHSFRKSIATIIDDAGMSARIGADQLGHSKVSMTQDKYMTRGRVHTQVADLLENSIHKRHINGTSEPSPV